MNDAVDGNFQSNVYACSVGVPEVQDFEDCSVYRPNKGPFPVTRRSPTTKTHITPPAAVVDRRHASPRSRKCSKTLHQDAWAIPICMRGLLCGQQRKVAGVVYDAKTHLVYQEIVKS